jgi:hypothetical protein
MVNFLLQIPNSIPDAGVRIVIAATVTFILLVFISLIYFKQCKRE